MEVAATVYENVPAWHRVHSLAALGEKDPVGHTGQSSAAPDADWKYPAKQSVQTSDATAPTLSENVPGKQRVHADWPERDAYDPPEQARQSSSLLAPNRFEYVPVPHSRQVAEVSLPSTVEYVPRKHCSHPVPLQYLPCLQTEQSVLPTPRLNRSPGHSVQDDAPPPLNVPVGQGPHVREPSSALNNPGWHGKHKDFP